MNQRMKVAVETHAMNEALRYYGKLGKITDTSRTESFDYLVEIDGEPWHIEVKGTTNDPHEVLLTPREVEHAEQYPRVSLFVLSNITTTLDDRGEVLASGGKASVFHPWSLDRTRLTPVGYKYSLPE